MLDVEGAPIDLPASRKTRALLAYLALTEHTQLRDHLCDLLWDGPADPRGALRWSLSRLRSVLDGPGGPRITSDRRSVGLDADRFVVDLHRAHAILGDSPEGASLPALRAAATLFRGELLAGMDLLDSFRFHAWCVGQREGARALHTRVLTALADRLPAPEEALPHAHALVAIDPLNEAAHTKVIGLLMQMGRHTDAQEQLHDYRHLLEFELGEVPRDVTARLRRIIHADAPPTPPRVASTSRQVAPLPLVGRGPELDVLRAWLDEANPKSRCAIIGGDPGQGKTRLLQELSRLARRSGSVIGGRAYRAESSRAFGPWRDALQEVTGSDSVFGSYAGEDVDHDQRPLLFDELLALIVAHATDCGPVLITLDDLQWLDDVSAAFLHFAARSLPPGVKVLGTVRPGEVIDNPALGHVLESLRQAHALFEVALQPLDNAAIEAICAAIDARIPTADLVQRSEGNPFIAVELARALSRGEQQMPDNVLEAVESRLRSLSESSRELLPWAAALGRTFQVDVLERVTRLEPLSLVERVGELEERGVLEPRGENAYDFVHDLVREAAYRELSGPRRRIVHRSIARSLASWDAHRGAYSAAELLRHAELGNERALASRAALSAVRDALAVCAWVDACVAADRGLQYIEALEDAEERLQTCLDLLACRLMVGHVLVWAPPEHVVDALAWAVDTGGAAYKKRALNLEGVLQTSLGRETQAGKDVVAAADASRHADPESAARLLANSARCLLVLERDVSTARELLVEARAALEALGLEDAELHWATGLLARWDGDLDGAARELDRALRVAREAGTRWRQAACITHLIQVRWKAGHPDDVRRLAEGGIGGGSGRGELLKSPFVEALAGLADWHLQGRMSPRLLNALTVLRARRAHAPLAYVLSEAARMRLAAGELEEAEVAAVEAITAAEAAQRFVPHVDALATLVSVRRQRGDDPGAREALSHAMALSEGRDAVTAPVLARLGEHRSYSS